MKPWREVLAERGWTIKPCSDGYTEAYAPSIGDGWLWCVAMCRLINGGWSSWVEVTESPALCSATADTEDAAFSALMAKPIGPGRVTVGVLLGVSE